MSDFPVIEPFQPAAVNTCMNWALGVELALTASATVASGTWPSSNLAIYIPYSLPIASLTITGLYALNGATANSNRDIGVYDLAGNLIVSTGNLSQTGTNVVQFHALAEPRIVPGSGYLALVHNGTTGTYFRAAPAAIRLRMWGARQQALGSATLLAAATFAAPANAYLPVFGMTQMSLL